MLQDIREVMQFLESLGYEEQAYLVVSAAVPTRSCEVMLRKDRGDQPWGVRTHSSDAPWAWYARDGLLAELVHRGINLFELEERVRALALEQVVYADFVKDAAAKLFGKEALSAAKLAHQKFLDALADVVGRLARKHKVIEGEGQSTPKRRGHLRVL